MIRAILVILGFFIFFVCGIPVIGVLFLMRRFAPGTELYPTLRIIQNFVRAELWISGTKVKAEGLDNIPDDEPCLFVGNHQSLYDFLSTYIWMKRPTGYIAKKETGKVPVMHWWMILMNCLFLDRQNIKQGLQTILQAIEYVKEGSSIFIFPEGTRNKGEDKTELAEFKEGSLKIAQRTGCPVVPVAICNTSEVFENHKPFVRSTEVTICFLPPFYIADLEGADRKKPAAYTRGLIMQELKRRRSMDVRPQSPA